MAEIVFDPGQAPGAIPNGTIVEKCGSVEGDAHKDGARARVLSSKAPFPHPDTGEPTFGYFVEWEDCPGLPVFISGERVRELESPYMSDKGFGKGVSDFRQVKDDTTGKCWWQILCHWCRVVIEQYEQEDFPENMTPSVFAKLLGHSTRCYELLKKSLKAEDIRAQLVKARDEAKAIQRSNKLEAQDLRNLEKRARETRREAVLLCRKTGRHLDKINKTIENLDSLSK